MKKKVLIIEDDRDTLDLLNYIAEDLNLLVIASGFISNVFDVEALLPDLILLDHQVHGKLGSDFCLEIKANPLTKHIIVVMLSAHNNIAIISEKCCANGYLEKPFNLNELIALIEKFVATAT
jgi:DNA-binding response OmpR family regulator